MMTLPARCLKGFADGFGGGLLGGLVYWGVTGLLADGDAPFPVFRIAVAATMVGCYAAWRNSGQRPIQLR